MDTKTGRDEAKLNAEVTLLIRSCIIERVLYILHREQIERSKSP